MKEVEVLMKYKENQEKDCLGLLEKKVFQGKGILATDGSHFNISSFSDFQEKRSPPPTILVASPPPQWHSGG